MLCSCQFSCSRCFLLHKPPLRIVGIIIGFISSLSFFPSAVFSLCLFCLLFYIIYISASLYPYVSLYPCIRIYFCIIVSPYISVSFYSYIFMYPCIPLYRCIPIYFCVPIYLCILLSLYISVSLYPYKSLYPFIPYISVYPVNKPKRTACIYAIEMISVWDKP